MSTHNICFSGEIRKILCRYPLLSVAMWNFIKMLLISIKAYQWFPNILFRTVSKGLLQSLLGVITVNTRARENRKNSRSGPKLRILDRFQTPQNANKLVQQVCALNPIFPQPTNFHESMMSKKSQTVKSSQTENIRAPFKCDIMVVKRL